MKQKTKPPHIKYKDYSKYAFMNFSLGSMEGEEWKDLPQFDGCYSISNYGRVWAVSRPINTIDGKVYYTKERIRKQTVVKTYNSYAKEYIEHLCIKLRYEGGSYSFKISRLVYELFIGPINFKTDSLLVVHKDGDNCNNRYDNLVLMNGTELYGHGLAIKHRPRSGLKTKRGEHAEWSEINSPRPIVQYSLDGKKLNEYDSIVQAAQANNVHRVSIRKVAQQKLVQLHGLIYRYKDIPYYGEHAGFSYEKMVTQYDLNGNKVKTYSSVKEAGELTDIHPDTISKCALRKVMTCGGFVWRYKGDTYAGEYKNRIKNKAKTIVQYSLDGTPIASFISVNEASRLTGFNARVLLDCALKKSRVSHGFVWRFENEPYSGEYKQYRKGKPVTQHTLDGKKMNTYPTIEEAARLTGLTPDNIQKNVNGHNKTAGGFIWKFATLKEIQKLPAEPTASISSIKGKEVIQYSLDGKKMATYSSINEAAKAYNIAISGISAAVDKANRSAAGFVWRTKGNIYRGSLAKTPAANKARMVTQYDLNGDKLQVYNSIWEAGNATGISNSSISSAARGKLKSTGGFIWQYGDGPAHINVEEHYASTKEYIRSISKPVLKYSLTGELLNEYPSIREAARIEGIRSTTISGAINGQHKSAGGDFWILKPENEEPPAHL